MVVFAEVTMTPMLLFAMQATFTVAGVAILAVLLHRRLPAMWRSWVWGALSFVASQLVRIPFLLALTALLQITNLIPRDADREFVFWFNLLVLAFTAGLFEETARYLILRFLAKDVRGWNEAVMFGAGHGGIEAILLVGGTALINLFLILNDDMLVQQTRAVSPEQAAALAVQIDALRNVDAAMIGASLFERVFAIILHIGLSVMVMRAVQGQGMRWWALAVLVHAAANIAALVAQRAFGIVGAEAVVAVFGLALLAFTIRQRPPRAQPAPAQA